MEWAECLPIESLLLMSVSCFLIDYDRCKDFNPVEQIKKPSEIDTTLILTKENEDDQC